MDGAAVLGAGRDHSNRRGKKRIKDTDTKCENLVSESQWDIKMLSLRRKKSSKCS